MIAEIGHMTLAMGFALALLQTLAGTFDRFLAPSLTPIVRMSAVLQFVFVFISFVALVYAFAISDFSLRLVTSNSHSAKPLIYKISGAWGNHEGSILMWSSMLALFGAALVLFGGSLSERLSVTALAVQGAIGVFFLGFTLFSSNPFIRLDPPPLEGNGLNPLLQDIALAAHPPFLYLGYVGLSLSFSLAIASLLEKESGAVWASWLRPWSLIAWAALTMGIALGSYWAYYELGWGGWWFWDPVENASLMPWLLATALLHATAVTRRRGALANWTILLAILGFSFSLIGTFIVRSGIITSVHAFANDPERGTVILAMIAVTVTASLLLFALRMPNEQGKNDFEIISRESGILVNNLLLCVISATVLVGTLYPLILELLDGSKISVGAPFFNATFVPLILPLLLLLPIAAQIPWRRGELTIVIRRLLPASVIALLAAVALLILYGEGEMYVAIFALSVSIWTIFGTLTEYLYQSNFLRSAFSLPRATYGKLIAHLGVGICALGIAAVSGWQQEYIGALAPKQSFEFADYKFNLKGMVRFRGPNYLAQRGLFTVSRDDEAIGELLPERRFFPEHGSTTTEVAIKTRWLTDIYLVLGDTVTDGGRWHVRAYIKPLAPLIWIGATLMALGGLLCLGGVNRRRSE